MVFKVTVVKTGETIVEADSAHEAMAAVELLSEKDIAWKSAARTVSAELIEE